MLSRLPKCSIASESKEKIDDWNREIDSSLVCWAVFCSVLRMSHIMLEPVLKVNSEARCCYTPVAPMALSKAGALGTSIALPIQSFDPTELREKETEF